MNNYRLDTFWSHKDNAFIATCPEFEGLSVIADTREKALSEAEAVLASYIAIYKEDGVPLPEPQHIQEYSGQTRVRLGKGLHAVAAEKAALNNVSLNTLIVDAVSRYVGVLEGTSQLQDSLEKHIEQLAFKMLMLGAFLGIKQYYATPTNVNRLTPGESGNLNLFTIGG
jgi:predicted RNase H-like HicB family nuclease